MDVLSDLKSQMEKVNGLDTIHYISKIIRFIGQPANLQIEKAVTDGEFIYV